MASFDVQHMIECQLREMNTGWVQIEPGYYINQTEDGLCNIKLLEYDSDTREVLFCDGEDPRCFLHGVDDKDIVLVVDDDNIYMWYASVLRKSLQTLASMGLDCETVFDDSGDFIGQKLSLCFAYSTMEAAFESEIGNGLAPWSAGAEFEEYFGPRIGPPGRRRNVLVQ